MLTHDVYVMCCSTCGTIDNKAAPGADKPRDGDISLCITCGQFSIFDHRQPGQQRAPTAQELGVILRDERCRFARAHWIKHWAQ